MNQELKQILLQNGASLIGFAKLNELYSNTYLNESRNEATIKESYDIPHYPVGIAIAIAIPKSVIKEINIAPTMDYYDAYHDLNNKLDRLALLCAEYIKSQGYQAYPQTVSAVREYGNYRTAMPHKTVAVHAGLGWIGKSALFVTKDYGSALRLTSVLSDAPFICNEPTTSSKCGNCNQCEKACPGHAISGQNWSPELDRDIFFDALACRKKAREIAAKTLDKEITLCGKCIEICPYTRRYIES